MARLQDACAASKASQVFLLLQLAMKRVQMCNAVKVLLAFSKPFWPESFFDVICTGIKPWLEAVLGITVM